MLKTLITALTIATATANSIAYEDRIAPLSPILQNYVEKADDVTMIAVEMEMPTAPDGTQTSPKWKLNETDFAVFFSRIAGLPTQDGRYDHFFKMFQPVLPYNGLRITFSTVGDLKLPPLRIHNGRITDDAGNLLYRDPGHLTEYWLLGTVEVRHQQLTALRVKPLFTYEQCVLMGHKIVNTVPRQCVTPIGEILLETHEKVTAKDLEIQTFDQCLEKGKGIINTFPRRCLAPGGRVIVEPARVLESNRKVKNVQPTGLVETLK